MRTGSNTRGAPATGRGEGIVVEANDQRLAVGW
jgi:hypothetical protein